MASASLKYTDPSDRAFGLCGMAFALFIYEADSYIDSLSIDAPADNGLKLTPDFFSPANPNLSVKSVWRSSFRNFQLVAAMVMGNLLSRSLARRRSDLSGEVQSLLFSNLAKEGEEKCGLEAQEVEDICSKAFGVLNQLLRHPAVNSAICSMTRALSENRTMSREQILPYLLPLQRL